MDKNDCVHNVGPSSKEGVIKCGAPECAPIHNAHDLDKFDHYYEAPMSDVKIALELRDKAAVLKLTDLRDVRGRIIVNQVAGFLEEMADKIAPEPKSQLTIAERLRTLADYSSEMLAGDKAFLHQVANQIARVQRRIEYVQKIPMSYIKQILSGPDAYEVEQLTNEKWQ